MHETCCIHHEKVCEVQWKKETICPNNSVKSHLPGATDNRQILLVMAHVLWNSLILWWTEKFLDSLHVLIRVLRRRYVTEVPD